MDNLNLIPIEDFDVKHFFKQASKKGEYLGLIDIAKKDIHFLYLGNITQRLNYFFVEGLCRSPHRKTDLKAGDYQSEEIIKWQEQIEFYVKLVWLTKEFLNLKEFKNFMGAIYNPVQQKWNIHPGGSRQIIHYLFGRNTQTFLGFNTGGFNISWRKQFSGYKEFFNYFPNAFIVVCDDFNTFVPHVHFEAYTIYPNVIDTFYKVKEFYETTNIISNFNMQEYGYVPPKTYNKSIKVTVYKKHDKHDIFKAFLLLPCFFDLNLESFNNYGVKIVIA